MLGSVNVHEDHIQKQL